MTNTNTNTPELSALTPDAGWRRLAEQAAQIKRLQVSAQRKTRLGQRLLTLALKEPLHWIPAACSSSITAAGVVLTWLLWNSVLPEPTRMWGVGL